MASKSTPPKTPARKKLDVMTGCVALLEGLDEVERGRVLGALCVFFADSKRPVGDRRG